MMDKPIGPTFDNSSLGEISKPFSGTTIQPHQGTTAAHLSRAEAGAAKAADLLKPIAAAQIRPA